MSTVPQTELQDRVGKLQQNLRQAEITGALIMQGVDLYYYSGFKGTGCLYVPAEGTPLYLGRQRGELPPLPWPTVKYERWGELAQHIKDAGYQVKGRLGLEMDVIPAALYQKLTEVLTETVPVDISQIIRLQRALKSAWELNLFKETAKRDLLLWAQVPELIRQAQNELEVVAGFEAAARRLGHLGLIRMRSFNMEMSITMTLAGELGALPSPQEAPINGKGLTPAFPFGPSGALIESGKPILIDYGANYFGYILDQTRNFVKGYLPADVERAYETSLAIQAEVARVAKVGVTCGEVYELARALAIKAGLEEGFMGAAGGVPFVGHGVGLEIDELPVLVRGSRQVLEEGMVVAVEPKFALPGFGAVGVENCFVVTAGGLDKISIAPDELEIIR